MRVGMRGAVVVKEVALACCAVVVIAVVAASRPTRAEPPDAIGVEALMKNVERHKGPLRVRGIVGETIPDKSLFSLVDLSDREELLRTGRTQCVTLPVRWTKELPPVHAVVLVDGEVEELDGRLIFSATGVTSDNEQPPGSVGAGTQPDDCSSPTFHPRRLRVRRSSVGPLLLAHQRYRPDGMAVGR
jgi:hypothetical protein